MQPLFDAAVVLSSGPQLSSAGAASQAGGRIGGGGAAAAARGRGLPTQAVRRAGRARRDESARIDESDESARIRRATLVPRRIAPPGAQRSAAPGAPPYLQLGRRPASASPEPGARRGAESWHGAKRRHGVECGAGAAQRAPARAGRHRRRGPAMGRCGGGRMCGRRVCAFRIPAAARWAPASALRRSQGPAGAAARGGVPDRIRRGARPVRPPVRRAGRRALAGPLGGPRCDSPRGAQRAKASEFWSATGGWGVRVGQPAKAKCLPQAWFRAPSRSALGTVSGPRSRAPPRPQNSPLMQTVAARMIRPRPRLCPR
jgi:hypothetical protein